MLIFLVGVFISTILSNHIFTSCIDQQEAMHKTKSNPRLRLLPCTLRMNSVTRGFITSSISAHHTVNAITCTPRTFIAVNPIARTETERHYFECTSLGPLFAVHSIGRVFMSTQNYFEFSFGHISLIHKAIGFEANDNSGCVEFIYNSSQLGAMSYTV